MMQGGLRHKRISIRGCSLGREGRDASCPGRTRVSLLDRGLPCPQLGTTRRRIAEWNPLLDSSPWCVALVGTLAGQAVEVVGNIGGGVVGGG